MADLDAVRVRARFTADYLASRVDDAPVVVREFMYQDVPDLLSALTQVEADRAGQQPLPPTDQLGDALDLHARLVHLVELIRLANGAEDNPVLHGARESDVAELLGQLCVHRRLALGEIAARELAETGWTGAAALPPADHMPEVER